MGQVSHPGTVDDWKLAPKILLSWVRFLELAAPNPNPLASGGAEGSCTNTSSPRPFLLRVQLELKPSDLAGMPPVLKMAPLS